VLLRLLLVAVLLLIPTEVSATDCEPEPASQWAPAGWVCPPMYGEGIASTYPGSGAARNDCVYPWRECPSLVVMALDTGRSITVTPVTWCHCYVNAPGPNGETARIIDLTPEQVAALGLELSKGLWAVRVEPATAALPDTSMKVTP
jgi:hypothetical protein